MDTTEQAGLLREALKAWERDGAPNRKSLAAFGLRAALALAQVPAQEASEWRIAMCPHCGEELSVENGAPPAQEEPLDVGRLRAEAMQHGLVLVPLMVARQAAVGSPVLDTLLRALGAVPEGEP